MVTGGLRDTEVANANIEDIRTLGDFTVLYVLGKGRDEKSDYVKVVGQVEDAIRDYLKERGAVSKTDPLFASLSNNSKGGRLSTRSVSRICKNALVAAGYDSSRLTAHSLRHTAVTLSLLGGNHCRRRRSSPDMPIYPLLKYMHIIWIVQGMTVRRL